MREQGSGLVKRVPTQPVKRRATANDYVVTNDYDLQEEEEYYVTRPHTSARRYDRLPVPDEQVFQEGNRTYHVRHGAPPRRQHQYFEEEQEPKPRRKAHKLLYVGITIIAIIAVWQGLNDLGYRLQQKQDDWTYGKNRVYTTDAVVGHNCLGQ